MAARVGLDRAMVLKAAVALLDSDGVSSFSFATLAARLGVKYQSLYPHVGTPDELKRDLNVMYLHSVRDATRDAAIGLAGRAAVQSIAAASWRHDIENPGLTALHLRQGLADPELQQEIEDATSALSRVLESYALSDEQRFHWRRSINATVYGFSALEASGMLFEVPSSLETLTMTIDAVIDAIEKLSRQNKRKLRDS